MLPEIEKRVEFLKQVLIFNEFDDNELAQVADRLKEALVEAGEVVFFQGQVPEKIYIIVSGQVRVTRVEDDGTETVLANFDVGDTFGEDALYFQRRRSATITAIHDAEFLYLDKEDFQWLRKTFPQVEPYLVASTQTHKISSRLNINWLSEGETVSLIARRFPIRLIGELIATAFLVASIITVLIGLGFFLKDINFFDNSAIPLFSMAIGGIVGVLGIVVGIWSYVEWRNDYFIVTNIRVVWRERILLRSTSRQEVPLRTIQSLNVHTRNALARMIHVGDVVVHTFNSQLRLTDVSHPERMKDMIDGFLLKARTRSRRAEHTAIRQTIRRQLGYQVEEITPDIPENIPPADRQKTRRFALFNTRIVEDETITYRKHWLIFLKRVWRPSLLLIVALLFSGCLTPVIFKADWGSKTLILLFMYLIPFGIFLFWLYQYEDWRNDIYRVTKDQIIDREKKPLGKESFQSAPIKNIQSVGHEIPNTIGLMLNVGNVWINVGDRTLTFEGVHDPALVHQDIFKRMEALAAEVERSRIAQEHERMATWLEIYHEETNDDGPFENSPDSF